MTVLPAAVATRFVMPVVPPRLSELLMPLVSVPIPAKDVATVRAVLLEVVPLMVRLGMATGPVPLITVPAPLKVWTPVLAV